MKPKLLLCLALVLSGYCRAAITYPKAPDGGRLLVTANANEILRSDPNFLAGFRIEELTTANPYGNYYVGLTNLASGQLLAAVRPGGWTYLFMHGTNAVGAEELIANEKTGNALQFNGFYQSNFSNETLEALRIAEKLPQTRMQDYEVRRLGSAPILFHALWLHGKSDDIIITLAPAFGRWTALQPYSESQMIRSEEHTSELQSL